MFKFIARAIKHDLWRGTYSLRKSKNNLSEDMSTYKALYDESRSVLESERVTAPEFRRKRWSELKKSPKRLANNVRAARVMVGIAINLWGIIILNAVAEAMRDALTFFDVIAFLAFIGLTLGLTAQSIYLLCCRRADALISIDQFKSMALKALFMESGRSLVEAYNWLYEGGVKFLKWLPYALMNVPMLAWKLVSGISGAAVSLVTFESRYSQEFREMKASEAAFDQRKKVATKKTKSTP